MRSFALLALLGPTVSAAAGPYTQCGGESFTGETTCASGYTCTVSDQWYSQCLPASSSGGGNTLITTTTSTNRTSTSTSPASSGSAVGRSFKTSVTFYGAGDTFGSPNCNTNTAACFFYTDPGFSAAVSQNLYGAGPGQGQGPGCGTCWRITGETDSSGQPLSNAGTSVIVQVNNLCPADGNPLCSQGSLSDTNQYGANVNFDLCRDSGAADAFFGSSGVGLALGTAEEVDCSLWSGTVRT